MIYPTCESPNCNNAGKMKCPICSKNAVNSYFCSQECFKRNFAIHKAQNHVNLEKEKWPGFPYTGKLRSYVVTPMRKVPEHIERPDYADHPKGIPMGEQLERCSNNIETLSPKEIDGVRLACRLGREVLDIALEASKIGVTTEQIDRIVHEACIERNCYPSPLNYHTFPKSCCTSINEVICHGIPDSRPLTDGDILNIDVTVFHQGFHGDLNETIFIGNRPDNLMLFNQSAYVSFNTS